LHIEYTLHVYMVLNDRILKSEDYISYKNPFLDQSVFDNLNLTF